VTGGGGKLSDSGTRTVRQNNINLSDRIGFSADTSTNIASGVITISGNRYSVDTQSSAATDDLDTINGGLPDQLLVLGAYDSARTVVVKDGTGNLKLEGDCSLDNAEDRIVLIANYDGTVWHEVSRSNNGA
jgi:hypothetical protein